MEGGPGNGPSQESPRAEVPARPPDAAPCKPGNGETGERAGLTGPTARTRGREAARGPQARRYLRGQCRRAHAPGVPRDLASTVGRKGRANAGGEGAERQAHVSRGADRLT
jgi:hypothetical protein